MARLKGITPNYDWIRAIYYRDRNYPAKTTEDELDAAERQLNVLLPSSYRDFAQRFGLGGRFHTLPDLIPLTPLPGTIESEWWNAVVTATRFFRSEAAGLVPVVPSEFLERAVVFGFDEGAYTFAFDTGQVTHSDLHEYRIYSIPRHESPVLIADTFEHWLEWIDKGYRLSDDGSEEERNKEIWGLIFDPDSSKASPMPYWRAPFLVTEDDIAFPRGYR